MNKNILFSIVALFLIVLSGLYYFSNLSTQKNYDENAAPNLNNNTNLNSETKVENEKKTENKSPTKTTEKLTVSGVTSTSSPAVVVYGEKGFSPSTITIKEGETVTFVNQSGKKMWVGSADHPTHTKYSGTALKEHCPDNSLNSFDQCGSGDIYTFIFKKIGTWGYHNHIAGMDKGEVVVIK